MQNVLSQQTKKKTTNEKKNLTTKWGEEWSVHSSTIIEEYTHVIGIGCKAVDGQKLKRATTSTKWNEKNAAKNEPTKGIIYNFEKQIITW